ncbi:hypothetical protein CGZ98_16410 [Enemella evansiae]|nr:hypothetical protein CGZ98_16410 [Enemella evansiae]
MRRAAGGGAHLHPRGDADLGRADQRVPGEAPVVTSERDGTPGRALTALAGVVFVFLVAELLPVGQLPQLQADLDATPAQVGALISGYALVAGVFGIPLTLLTRRLPRRTVLCAALVWLAAGQLVLAAAPTLAVAAVARAGIALVHVPVWGLAPLVAAELVEPGRQAWASSRVFLGTSLALLAGVPIATLASQQLGWRPVTGAVAIAAVVLAGTLWRQLPPGRAERGPADPPLANRADRAGTQGTVAITGGTLLVVTALYLSYPYLSVFAARVGIERAGYAALLAGCGIGSLAAVWLAGRWIDERPWRTSVLTLLLVGVLQPGLLAEGPAVVAVTAVLWAGSIAATPVVLQAAVIRVAGPGGDLTSSAYVVAYQAGIALGTWVGGLLIGRGLLVGAVAIALAVLSIPLLARTVPGHRPLPR